MNTAINKQRPTDIADRLAQWSHLRVGEMPNFVGRLNWAAELNADLVNGIAEITRLRENLAAAHSTVTVLENNVKNLRAAANRPRWRRLLDILTGD